MKFRQDRQIEYWAHMLDEAFKPEKQVCESSPANFSGINFQKSKPWTAGENAAAKKLFYATDEAVPYGYIMPDGTKLDFSKPMKGGSGEIDHSAIISAFSEERKQDLMRRAKAAGNDADDWSGLHEEIKYEAAGAGLIRLYKCGYAYMVHVIQKPTAAQMDALYDIRDNIDEAGITHVEYYGPKSGLVEYESTDDFRRRFMNDVRNSF